MEQDYQSLRTDALHELAEYMDSLDEKTAKKLAYWVKDYSGFLRKEKTFDPKRLVSYSRGAIIKAHLGFRIGSEEGGLHYAIVLDVKNAISSPTVTIIPLTSIKENTDLTKLHFSKLPLGKEIYNRLNEKFNATLVDAKAVLNELDARKAKIESEVISPDDPDWKVRSREKSIAYDSIRSGVDKLNKKIAHCERVKKELLRMKSGSIAHIGQITTISKLRIYDPMYPYDSLSNVNASNDVLDRLDEKIKEFYTKT